MKRRHLLLAPFVALADRADAWGPHSEITRAACATLPALNRLDERLIGADALAEYCWMADYREHAFPHYFADDYLLFPSSPRHLSHLLPDVRATYAPFWKRALQALRTESPTNAARWVGSLLHFVQDSGSPPHTTGVTGELHSRMENWLDAKAVRIDGYSPQLLGGDEADALRGFLLRMEQLVTFSKLRAERAKPHCEANNRAAAEPIILESALETARVTADVISTLLTIAPIRSRPTPGATLRVRITAPLLPGLLKSPARLVLLTTGTASTDFATVAEPSLIDDDAYLGDCTLRDLPPGRYRAAVYRAGSKAQTVRDLHLRAGETRQLEVRLEGDQIPGNLLRDPPRRVSYVVPEVLDHWQRVGAGDSAAWRTTVVAVEAGARYRIGVLLQAETAATVRVRWDHFTTEAALRIDTLPSDGERSEATLTAPERSLNVRLLITTTKPLESAVRHAWIVKEPSAAATFRFAFVRATGLPEAEIIRAREGDAVVTTSITHRGNTPLILVTTEDEREQLRSARVTQSANVASAEFRDGQVVVQRGDQQQTFVTGPRLIVTSAPDWTDTVLLCLRYDRDRRGLQSFPALWFHPQQPAQLLTFTAERMNGDTLDVGGAITELDKLILTIRGGSRYLAWTKADGTMLKLVPTNRSGFAQEEQALYLKGFESVARELK